MSKSPATLVAIAYACHVTGDREIKREAVQMLRELYGIQIRFMRAKPDKATQGGAK